MLPIRLLNTTFKITTTNLISQRKSQWSSNDQSTINIKISLILIFRCHSLHAVGSRKNNSAETNSWHWIHIGLIFLIIQTKINLETKQQESLQHRTYVKRCSALQREESPSGWTHEQISSHGDCKTPASRACLRLLRRVRGGGFTTRQRDTALEQESSDHFDPKQVIAWKTVWESLATQCGSPAKHHQRKPPSFSQPRINFFFLSTKVASTFFRNEVCSWQHGANVLSALETKWDLALSYLRQNVSDTRSVVATWAHPVTKNSR